MRTVTEWLLLPLFLLPFTVGGGLAWFAAETHRREIEKYAEAGDVHVKRWLAEDSNAAMVAGSAERAQRHVVHDPWTIPFTHPGGNGRVVVADRQDEERPWRFTRAFPSGLTPEALADAGVRLRVETGAAPGSLDGADEATVAFRDLYGTPDLDALRIAPLPVSTKRFLLRRWREGADGADFAEEARLLDALDKAMRTWPRTPGMHEVDGAIVLAAMGDGPSWVFPDRESMGSTFAFGNFLDHEKSIGVTWSFFQPDTAPETTLWSGRIEEPYAGTWRISRHSGREWWQSTLVRRWGGPVVGALALFLVLPSALLISIRRRRRLDETRVRFLNETAHDLRTPLTSLRLYADMLAAGKADEEQRDRYVDTIARESARLTSLLGNLLDLSRLEGKRRTFEPEDLPLDEVAEHAIADFVALWPKRADDVRVAGEDDVRVTADRTALARCLGNLLDNAGKFTEVGATVTLSWEEIRGRVRIVIADDGPGIPAGERKRVFARYARGRKAQDDGVPGTGLGLSLVRTLCRGMGGDVRLVDRATGAAFEIDLPGGAS